MSSIPTFTYLQLNDQKLPQLQLVWIYVVDLCRYWYVSNYGILKFDWQIKDVARVFCDLISIGIERYYPERTWYSLVPVFIPQQV